MKTVKIISITHDTPNVLHVRTEKPEGIAYIPGQAVDVAIAKPEWASELRPFTFTSLPNDSYLEFFLLEHIVYIQNVVLRFCLAVWIFEILN